MSFIRVPFSLQSNFSILSTVKTSRFLTVTCCSTISQFKPKYAWHEAFFYFFFIYLLQMRCPFFLEGSGCCTTTPRLKSTHSKIIPTRVVSEFAALHVVRLRCSLLAACEGGESGRTGRVNKALLTQISTVSSPRQTHLLKFLFTQCYYIFPFVKKKKK